MQYQTAQTFFFADTELLRPGCPVESSLPLRNHRMTFARLQYVQGHFELLALIGTSSCLFAYEAPANGRLRYVAVIALSFVCRSRPGFRRRAFDGDSGLADVPILSA